MSISKAPSLRAPTDDGLRRMSREYDEPPYVQYPEWFKYIEYVKEPAAEFLGTMVLIILGVGTDLQIGLSQSTAVSPIPKGNELSINLGWASAVALGVWIASASSAGHCNPALTIGLAAWRGFPWRKVPGYVFAQTFGAFVGTAIVYGNYIHAIDLYEGGKGIRTLASAGFLSSYPLEFMTNISAFFCELLATGVIFFAILALGDKRHSGPVGPGYVPLMLWILVLGIGTALGMETNYAVNPARDLGSRLLAALVGYGGQVFMFRGQYWLWCPIIAPILGCLLAGLIYDTCLFSADGLPPSPPPPPSPAAIPHKLKFDTYRSERSIRADSHLYDIDQNVISVSAA